MLQFQYLPGYIGATLMLCLLLGMLAVPALRESHRNVAVKSKTRFWVVFAFFAAIATIHGGGKTNNTQCVSAPARVRSVMPAPTTSSPVSNEFAALPPLEASSVQRDEFSFGGTFTWRGAEGVPTATTIDIFATWPTLTNKWKWVGHAEVLGPVVSQQWSVATYQLGVDQMPQGLFVKFKERSTSASTMDDWDGDLLPGVYEVVNQTNPYVSDFNDAPKLTVGSKGQYATLRAAFTAARPYSIVQLPSDEITQASEVVMPPYPVMVVGPTNGYARISSSGMPYAFAFQDGQDYETIFQNIYLDLLPSSSMRVGFWCGGDLPTYSHYPAASATFRNVYLRERGANGRGFGWYFRRWHSSPAFIENCVLNAEGSSNFIGISAIDAPNLSISNCTFVNFPKMDVDGQYGVAVQIENTAYQDQTTTTTVANCVFDNSFTNAYPLGRLGEGYVINAENCILPQDFVGVHRPDSTVGIVYASNSVAWTGHVIAGGVADEMGIGALAAIGEASTLDSDNDGLTDWEEIYRHATDPFKADSDGDRILDADEVLHETNPLSPLDFSFQVTVELPVSYPTNQNVWVSFADQMLDTVLVEPYAEQVLMPTCHVTNGVVPHLIISNRHYSVERSLSITNFSNNVLPPDYDNDKMDDFWELAAGLCPTNSDDKDFDPDGDGLLNALEYSMSLNPFLSETNTLSSLIARSVDDRITGKDPSLVMPRFDNYYQNGLVNTFTPNTDFWLADVDLSGLCMWNDGSEHNLQAITLISPRHVIFAWHYSDSMPLSKKYYFRGRSGVVYERSILQKDSLLGDADGNDIAVGLLNAELPINDVSPLCVLPENFYDYIGDGYGLPVVFIEQNERGHIGTCNGFTLSRRLDFAFSQKDVYGRSTYYKGAVMGDSSSPKLFVAGNIPILLGVTHTRGGASGRFVSQYIDDINNLMHSQLSEPEYSLNTFDCQGYNTGEAE